MVLDRRKALALLCLTSEPLPNATNSSDVLVPELKNAFMIDSLGKFKSNLKPYLYGHEHINYFLSLFSFITY